MSKFSDKNDLPTTLFPHSYLSERQLRRIISSFGPITIFQPWFMAPPDFLFQKGYQDVFMVLNPPPNLKPNDDFKGLLSEYKTWIKQHRGKSSAAFLKASQSMGSAGNTTWEIREALRGKPRTNRQTREEQQSLRWHLTLHLARDMEEEQREADRLLRELKNQESPIKDLLGEEDVKNPLTDLSQMDSDQLATLYPLDRIFEAWFGLFGGYLTGGEVLLTFSRHVMDHAAEVRDALVKVEGNRISKDFSGGRLILVEED